MSRRRLHRLGTTLFVLLSLLFSQLALASYVCPQQADPAAMAAMAGMPCDDMDAQQPALCHQHAADPGKTFETAKLPTVSLPALIQMLALPLVRDDGAAAPAVVPAAQAELRPPPDPLFLSTLRLRV
ncbi:hypothetical protein [Roseateles saccharophilus]|uniref:Uncharacterized protein n=1 Tax=Roseateles saccharophilus TaxID=304 RepID=A0A4R3VHG5_ROSSA|nr:hypothetical protein [Roseateles saccharophilus]MDG0833854.1 hypothetical protein [Roseateles saccharophilus]TCV02325.1 hypothetical protein EV671_100498 [Roseateles saccharophilus]